MRRHDDSAIAGAGNRRPDYRLAEVRVVPADGGAAVGIVHVDGDIAAALGGGEFCLSVRRGPESQAARRDCRPPAEMLLSDGAVEAADIAHVDETLGREVHGALTQCPRRGVVDERVRRTVTEGRGVRSKYGSTGATAARSWSLISSLLAAIHGTGCRFRDRAAIGRYTTSERGKMGGMSSRGDAPVADSLRATLHGPCGSGGVGARFRLPP